MKPHQSLLQIFLFDVSIAFRSNIHVLNPLVSLVLADILQKLVFPHEVFRKFWSLTKYLLEDLQYLLRNDVDIRGVVFTCQNQRSNQLILVWSSSSLVVGQKLFELVKGPIVVVFSSFLFKLNLVNQSVEGYPFVDINNFYHLYFRYSFSLSLFPNLPCQEATVN